MPDLETLLSTSDPALEPVSSLYTWSTNFDPGEGPFALYLDLIGWSADNLGQPIYDLATANLGYVELHKLAQALESYSDNPRYVLHYVEQLMEAEGA